MSIQYLRLTAQASNYDCGAYGAGNYNENSCQTSTGGGGATDPGATGGTSGGGFLADTGYGVIIPVALAAAILVASIIYAVKQQIRRRHANHS